MVKHSEHSFGEPLERIPGLPYSLMSQEQRKQLGRIVDIGFTFNGPQVCWYAIGEKGKSEPEPTNMTFNVAGSAMEKFRQRRLQELQEAE